MKTLVALVVLAALAIGCSVVFVRDAGQVVVTSSDASVSATNSASAPSGSRGATVTLGHALNVNPAASSAH